jgi:hypothetical protein
VYCCCKAAAAGAGCTSTIYAAMLLQNAAATLPNIYLEEAASKAFEGTWIQQVAASQL